MPSQYRTLDRTALCEVVADELFAASDEGFGLGLELLPVRWRGEAAEPVSLLGAGGLAEHVTAFAEANDVGVADAREGADARAGTVEGEPPSLRFGAGGQVICDVAGAETPRVAFERCAAVLDELRVYLAQEGVELISVGSNPWHDTERVGLQDQRAGVRCLDEVLASLGEMGTRALRLTAGASVRVPFGSPVLQPLRWRAAQLLAPAATAIFASSPLCDGAHHGFKSVRGNTWRLAEPTRTGFPRPFRADPTGDPVEQYLDYALAARVVFIKGPSHWVPQTRPLTFWYWAEYGVEGVYPDLDDWRDHLATLRPEVRPLGCYELRSADAQGRAFWSVPMTFWSALLCDDEALSAVIARLLPSAEASLERWELAARTGLLDPDLAAEARWLFGVAADALLRLPQGWISTEMLAAFVTFGRRYAQRGLTPADELLDLFLERGGLGRSAWSELEDRRRRVAGTPRKRAA
jgi:glutamate--cysteine ligase